MNPNSRNFASSFPSYQISNVSSFFNGVKNNSSNVYYHQSTKDIFTPMEIPFPNAHQLSGTNSGLTQVSITQTLTRNYSIRSNGPNHLETISYNQILCPKPITMIFPNENSSFDYRLTASFMSPDPSSEHNQDVRKEKRGRKRKNVSKEKEYDGRMHSLPCKKYGPYTCPKCNSVFVTSQKFAAHSANHYRSEGREENKRRYYAKNKSKMVKLNAE